MELVPYNSEHTPVAQGMRNIGSTCYFNSMLQCILSCPSIYARSKESPDVFAKIIKTLFDHAIAGQSTDRDCMQVYNAMLATALKNKENLSHGQQDAHEGLMMLAELFMQIPPIYKLFLHRYQVTVTCNDCGEQVSETKDANIAIAVQLESVTERSISYEESVLEDYKCPKCSSMAAKTRVARLKLAPTILVLVFKKYDQKKDVDFPLKLSINNNHNATYNYEIVAQSEHSGTSMGGHYWTVARRADGWAQLNDMYVSAAQPQHTANTYMVFYHYMSTTPI